MFSFICQATRNPYRGGVVDELESVVPDDDAPDSRGDDTVGETLVACIQTSERMESEDWDIVSCVSELSWMDLSAEGEEA